MDCNYFRIYWIFLLGKTCGFFVLFFFFLKEAGESPEHRNVPDWESDIQFFDWKNPQELKEILISPGFLLNLFPEVK